MAATFFTTFLWKFKLFSQHFSWFFIFCNIFINILTIFTTFQTFLTISQKSLLFATFFRYASQKKKKSDDLFWSIISFQLHKNSSFKQPSLKRNAYSTSCKKGHSIISNSITTSPLLLGVISTFEYVLGTNYKPCLIYCGIPAAGTFVEANLMANSDVNKGKMDGFNISGITRDPGDTGGNKSGILAIGLRAGLLAEFICWMADRCGIISGGNCNSFADSLWFWDAAANSISVKLKLGFRSAAAAAATAVTVSRPANESIFLSSTLLSDLEHLRITPLAIFLADLDDAIVMTDFGLGLHSFSEQDDVRVWDPGDSGIGEGVEQVDDADSINGIDGAHTMSSWSVCSSNKRFSFSSSEASMVVVLSLPFDSRRIRRSRAPFANATLTNGCGRCLVGFELTASLVTCWKIKRKSH